MQEYESSEGIRESRLSWVGSKVDVVQLVESRTLDERSIRSFLLDLGDWFKSEGISQDIGRVSSENLAWIVPAWEKSIFIEKKMTIIERKSKFKQITAKQQEQQSNNASKPQTSSDQQPTEDYGNK